MIMKIYPFKDCCKQAAIKAYNRGRIFYLVTCDSCENLFPITDELAFFIGQAIAYNKIKPVNATFDFVLSDGNIIFLLPWKKSMNLYSPKEIEEIVIMERLYLYNNGLSYGAKAISKTMKHKGIRPLPSITTINRILSRNCLTHRRTGYYPEDYC